MWLALLMLLLGVALLTYGADRLVAGSSAIALRTGISPLLIGLTVVAFATSSPELVVSVMAALQGQSAIAVGNVVGSNIANLGLVLAAAALLYPVRCEQETFKRELPVMVGAVALPFILLYNGMITRIEGMALLLLLVAFVAWQVHLARRQMANHQVAEEVGAYAGITVGRAALFVVFGTGCLYVGSEAFLSGAITIGRALGVSEAVIGLTLVSVGTSLPELATTVAAAFKRETGMVLGNIIGSNVFNVLAVLGITATIIPLGAGGISYVDLSVMLLFALVVWMVFAWRRDMGRLFGGLLLGAYLAYLAWLLV
ncbi:calcium/sodium:proton antiporter [Ectothiorhodospira haloalkaliphila]|uniref:Calcium/sodium:proton antiporter n=1 Tax=Ectothiorhodospira haloalkaliphila TaxID=421628 RepID=W8KVT5_9GAMM|nr:calcium/sodium antiporter [Ectothiorhodospira haloalkaliphila]AHK79651.1 calcium/sodium:proton antiporter [Ectothiorhodospira haloalkaliphila]